MLKAQGADAELCMTSSEAKTRLDEAEFARKRVHLVSALVSPATTHLSASLRRATLSRSSSARRLSSTGSSRARRPASPCCTTSWRCAAAATRCSAPLRRAAAAAAHTFPGSLAAQCQKWTAGMWKVVISTQELTEREQQQCREAGVRYFWTKPATVDAREGQQGVRELLAEYRLWAAQQDVSPDL